MDVITFSGVTDSKTMCQRSTDNILLREECNGNNSQEHFSVSVWGHIIQGLG